MKPKLKTILRPRPQTLVEYQLQVLCSDLERVAWTTPADKNVFSSLRETNTLFRKLQRAIRRLPWRFKAVRVLEYRTTRTVLKHEEVVR